jgi:hypothetical protein
MENSSTRTNSPDYNKFIDKSALGDKDDKYEEDKNGHNNTDN